MPLEIPQKLDDWNLQIIEQLIELKFEETEQLEYWQHGFGQGEEGRQELEGKICSFANTSGGFVICGIKEIHDKNPNIQALIGLEIKGIDNKPNLDGVIVSVIKETKPIVKFTSRAITLKDEKVLWLIKIDKGLDLPVLSSKGIAYIRIGSHSLPMNRDQIKTMFIETDIKHLRFKRLIFEIDRMIEACKTRTNFVSWHMLPPFDRFDPAGLRNAIRENYELLSTPEFTSALNNIDDRFSAINFLKETLKYELEIAFLSRTNRDEMYNEKCNNFCYRLSGVVETLASYLTQFKELLIK